MAQPTTLKPGSFKIEIGDGGSPETFVAPCGFTQRAFNRSKTLNEVLIPDCADPDAAIVTARDVSATSWEVSGEGILAGESLATWDKFFQSNTARNIKITETWGGAIGTIVYSGAAHLESYEVTATLGTRCTISITLKGDGALTRSPVLS